MKKNKLFIVIIVFCFFKQFSLLAEEPKLSIKCRAPKKRYLGQMCPYDITIRNIGKTPVKNIKIELVLPKESVKIFTKKGIEKKQRVKWDLQELAAGENKNFSLRTIVIKSMTLVAEVKVSADGIETIKQEVKTDVQGVFAMRCELVDINDPVSVGGSVVYEMTFTNTGSKEIQGPKLSFQWDKHLKFIKISGAKKVLSKENILYLSLPKTLKSREKTKCSIELKAIAEGDARGSASFDCKDLSRPVTLTESTMIYANNPKDKDLKHPAISCSLEDINDPVKLGKTETYKIQVKNQGNAELTNIQISCLLDKAMKLVNSGGETELQEKTKGKLNFKPLPSLKPQARANWVVTVNAQKAADARLQVEFKCDQLSRPVVREEATNFYE